MNNVTEIKNEKLGESYYEIKHQSGLKILVYPKKNYASSYAMFGTRYGSIDTQFKLSGEKEFTEVPEGIAHFLEHKLFESEDLDAFQRYAATGASGFRRPGVRASWTWPWPGSLMPPRCAVRARGSRAAAGRAAQARPAPGSRPPLRPGHAPAPGRPHPGDRRRAADLWRDRAVRRHRLHRPRHRHLRLRRDHHQS